MMGIPMARPFEIPRFQAKPVTEAVKRTGASTPFRHGKKTHGDIEEMAH